MSRKKWRTRVLGYGEERHPSQAATYRHVEHLRECYALGMSRVDGVTVEFNEGDGWHLFEIIRFPKRVDA